MTTLYWWKFFQTVGLKTLLDDTTLVETLLYGTVVKEILSDTKEDTVVVQTLPKDA